MEIKNSIVTITDRTSIVLTGVEKVDTATETNISAMVAGSNLVISGSKLFVQKLDIENHLLEVVGNIDCLKYVGKKIPLLKRVFK